MKNILDRLVYDNVTRTTSNTNGVSIVSPGFGDTFTVEWLDSSKISYGLYYAAIAENATGWGYTRKKDIRGAPYDFRKAPSNSYQYLLLYNL